jgi:glycosyltransferase involved in cell wall biosynthesis
MNTRSHFSIITPSFNQAEFLPRTLQSIKNQKEIIVEHIVVDPGSSDGSLEILNKTPHIKLITKKDKSQSEGINNGFKVATGEIVSWLNSDDVYFSENTLKIVKATFDENSDVDVVYGKAIFINEADEKIKDYYVYPNEKNIAETIQYQVGICQPAVFWRKAVYDQIGGLDETLNFQLDYEYWIRMLQSKFKWKFIDHILASHRWWPGMKTASKRELSLDESLNLVKKKFGYVHHKWAERMAAQLIEGADGIINTNTNTLKAEAINNKKIELLISCNTAPSTISQLSNHNASSAAKETLDWMKKNQIDIHQHTFKAEEINFEKEFIDFINEDDKNALSQARRPEIRRTPIGSKYISYRVSNAYSIAQKIEEYTNQIDALKSYIKKKQEENKNRSCVIVANGPSLNASLTDDLFKHDLIISNFAYLDKRLLENAKYFTTVNHTVAEQIYCDWRKLEHLDKFFPFWVRWHTPSMKNSYYVNATVQPEFSKDITRYASWRSTVSYFNMQLAYSLGYKTIYLVGFDNSYTQPPGSKEGDEIIQTEDDPNHFLPNYFRGKSWQAADTGNMSDSYIEAFKFSLANDCKIFNCTIGGKLEIFPRHSLNIDNKTKSQQSRILSHTEVRLMTQIDTLRNLLLQPDKTLYDAKVVGLLDKAIAAAKLTY